MSSESAHRPLQEIDSDITAVIEPWSERFDAFFEANPTEVIEDVEGNVTGIVETKEMQAFTELSVYNNDPGLITEFLRVNESFISPELMTMLSLSAQLKSLNHERHDAVEIPAMDRYIKGTIEGNH